MKSIKNSSLKLIGILFFLFISSFPKTTLAVTAIDRFSCTLEAVYAIALQDDGRIYLGGEFGSGLNQPDILTRVDINGNVDESFTPSINSYIKTLALQPDGKILIGGVFTAVNGETRNKIARLNIDGTLDTAFDPDANGTLNDIALQTNGKILIAGGFSTISGETRNYIARLNSNGTLDAAFNLDINNFVEQIIVQEDDKVLICGAFTSISGESRYFIARLETNGTLDLGFNPANSDFIHNMALQPDSKILLCYSDIIKRINPDGTDDTGFIFPDPDDPYTSYSFELLSLQKDGKILIGLLGMAGDGPPLRLDNDGNLDTNFHPPDTFDYSYDEIPTVQADNKIIVAAENDTYRLNADGTIEAPLDPNANDLVYTTAVQSDGKILIGGLFTSISGESRNYIARLNLDGTLDTGFDPSPNNRVWSIAIQHDGKIL